MKKLIDFDIDIDVQTSFDPSKIFPGRARAIIVTDDQKIKLHPAGIYFQNVPVDNENSNVCSIPYQYAEVLGFIKTDFLHLSSLDSFTDKRQIRDLLDQDVNWDLLKEIDVVNKLFHISNYYDIIQHVSPRSVDDLADLLALIRPGKQHLLYPYKQNKQKTRQVLYKKTDNKYYFKRSHAIGYALMIVVQLNQINSERIMVQNAVDY